MKKILKLILTIMLIVSLAFAITGCGNNKEKVESKVSEESKVEENGKSKTYNAINKI